MEYVAEMQEKRFGRLRELEAYRKRMSLCTV